MVDVKITPEMDNMLTEITMNNKPSELDGHVTFMWWFGPHDLQGCSPERSDDYPTVRVEFNGKGGWTLG